MGRKYLKVTDVPAGTYNRSVIVATNVARSINYYSKFKICS